MEADGTMGPQKGENCLNLPQTTLYHKRTHGTVSQSKGSARGGPGSAVPRHPPIRPIFHVSLPLDVPTLVVTDSPEYSPSEPPLGSYIRMRIATLNIHTHTKIQEKRREGLHIRATLVALDRECVGVLGLLATFFSLYLIGYDPFQ